MQLPDREYYTSDNEHMKQLRSKYQAHVSAMLKLTGFTDTDARVIGTAIGMRSTAATVATNSGSALSAGAASTRSSGASWNMYLSRMHLSCRWCARSWFNFAGQKIPSQQAD